MRDAFASETIDEIFKLSLAGGSTGLEAMTRLLRETTDDKTFDDLLIPFVAMTVDLNAQAPAPVTRGPALGGAPGRDGARRHVPAARAGREAAGRRARSRARADRRRRRRSAPT